MNNKLRLILGALLVLLIVGAYFGWRWFHSDERQVRKQMSGICEDVSKRPGEGNAAAALKLLSLGNRLAPHVEVGVHDVPIRGGFSADELTAHVSRARYSLDDLTVDIVDQLVTIRDNEALVDCVIHGRASSSQYQYRMDDDFHLQITLRKDEDGKWRFVSFLEGSFLER